MHPYYLKNKKKYNKEIEKLLGFGKTEVEELFKADFYIVVEQVKNAFESKLLANLPYVGGKQNANDTNNLVGCCEYAALFLVGKDYNLSNDQIGELLTKLEERHFKPLPLIVQKVVRKLLKKAFVHDMLKKMAEKSLKYSSEYPYAWEYRYEEPDNLYSHKYSCTRCGACMFLNEMGLGDIMPYICNIDFVAFAAFGLPYYRNEVIGYGDKKCTNLFKIDADVITDNWPPHGIRKDGLK